VAVADKVIVTNVARLKQKYTADKWAKLRAAIDGLIQADAGRGLKTMLVDLSSTAEMKKYKAAAVAANKAAEPKSNKQAVDKIYKEIRPAYVMLLGAVDVIPHQDLKNPLFSPPDDTDEFAFSDLPYACDAAYSTSIRKFLTPTRVVGRLPDVMGGSDVDYLIGLLNTAAGYQSQPAGQYDAFLGITAEVWRQSTDTSLRAIFGNAAGMKISPVDGPNWSAADLKAKAHFINCHGSPADWRFFGQKGNKYPTAHDATLLAGKLAAGTVLAAECCYGAELYDPVLSGGRQGMCNTYLASGAYAFLGSSTIAYGPAVGNGEADLICQYFLRQIRSGSSVGRACLEARLEYMRQSHTLTPTDLKTLGQFNLMGDPSLTPVQSVQPAPHFLSGAKMAKLGLAFERATRFLRRETLSGVSAAVGAMVYVAAETLKASPTMNKSIGKLRKLAEEHGLDNPSILSFAVEGPDLTPGEKKLAKAKNIPSPGNIYTLVQRLPVPPEEEKIIRIEGINAVEYDGMMETRSFFSR
jgi:hypothetical protein